MVKKAKQKIQMTFHVRKITKYKRMVPGLEFKLRPMECLSTTQLPAKANCRLIITSDSLSLKENTFVHKCMHF